MKNHPVASCVATSVNAGLMPELRDYQQDAYNAAFTNWESVRNVLLVLPTGAGKTVVLSRIVNDYGQPACVIAHRQELVSQISLALARNGVRHRIIGSKSVVRNIVQIQMMELGISYVDPQARVGVAGVDTIIRRDNLKSWCNQVRLWVIDEAHHVLRENKWGKAVKLFPNAVGLGVTATPERADGAGLGKHADGVFDVMYVGPNMRTLIDRGYLTDYRIIVPPSSFNADALPISKSTGDYIDNAVREAVGASSIVGSREVHGDIVTHYLKFAKGKLGVTFVPSIKIAEEVKQQFIDEGVPAEVVTGDTPDLERARILRKFKNRELLNLINVDLFGEGFDLPAIEVVSMARPTQSYGLYVQQFGRALRLMEGKSRAIIIDHVGNISRHKLPDMGRNWTLDRKDKKSKSDSGGIPTRVCLNPLCLSAYERFHDACPFCGEPVPAPAVRNNPKFVDGDLLELDDATLAAMRAEIAEVDGPAPDIVEMTNQYHRKLSLSKFPRSKIPDQVNKKFGEFQQQIADHDERREAQVALREQFAWWAGYRRSEGMSDKEIYKLFYIKFGMDWMTACTVHADQAYNLTFQLMEECA